LRYFPELAVERLDGEAEASGCVGVIGMIHLNRETPGREPPLPEPLAEHFGEPPKQGMQHREIVGVGGERMRNPELGADFGREHRAGIDATGLEGKLPASAAEDLSEACFADRGHLADVVELVLLEPEADIVGNVGEDEERIWGEERGLVSWTDGEDSGDSEDGSRKLCPHRPHCPHRCFRDQFVHRHSHRERQSQPVPGFPPDPLGYIHRGAE
jgi:hypothetical protein